MLCENCGEKPATFHYTKVVNGQKYESHLCEKCAELKGEVISSNNDFSYDKLLSGLLNFNNLVKDETNNSKHISEKCENCGLTFSEFKKVSKFGCSECYKHFEKNLEPVFRRIHGNSKHNGKLPVRTGEHVQLRKELNTLKEFLKQKIENEQFEEAAKLRDQIKSLEKKIMDDWG